MAQLNMHVSPEFSQQLAELMEERKFASKAEAIRTAVLEAVIALRKRQSPVDFSDWLGAGLAAPLNPKPRFASEDDLWDGP